MTVRERAAAHPCLERLLVAPTGDHEPLIAVVGRLQQLETLEALLAVDRAGTRREPTGELVAAVLWHGDGVDLDDGHRRQTGSAMSVAAFTNAVGRPVSARPPFAISATAGTGFGSLNRSGSSYCASRPVGSVAHQDASSEIPLLSLK